MIDTLLAFAVAHGLTVLPWALAALFFMLWRRERRRSDELEDIADRSLDEAKRSLSLAKKVARAQKARLN